MFTNGTQIFTNSTVETLATVQFVNLCGSFFVNICGKTLKSLCGKILKFLCGFILQVPIVNSADPFRQLHFVVPSKRMKLAHVRHLPHGPIRL